MAKMYKGNQLWKANQDPISESNPFHTKDVNSDAIKTQLNALASEEKLELVRELLEDINGSTATEETLATAKGVLDSLNAKDFATDTTLAQVKTELDLVKTELETIKANQLSGDQKVTLSGNLTELFGESLSDRPPANSVSVGATFMVVGDTVVYQSNGTDWVVISE
jgi:hypothetical protein